MPDAAYPVLLLAAALNLKLYFDLILIPGSKSLSSVALIFDEFGGKFIMSTFKGIVTEFPDIRIDYFRQSNDSGARPALACFLTHIHSDHLQGLEGFYGGPFIYCSAATKELLIKLERRLHRFNLAKGVLEARRCLYAEKEKKLKVIPLETPTMVEIGSGKSLRVTLFDANHCPGAVMFLIEGDGKAILYTGDIRAEKWWVDYLKRHPVLVPYAMGLKTLDKIYLDTSFAGRSKIHEVFRSKQDGIHELLSQVRKYPQDTIFHLNAWTFGYEEAWVALASAFDSKIHLSDYYRRLFHFIRSPDKYVNGPFLSGFEFGNSKVLGCTTSNTEARFHSCEKRIGCKGLEGRKNIVWISPVITRVGSYDVHEPGVGSGDLENQDDLELRDEHLKQILEILGPDVPESVRDLLKEARTSMKQLLPLSLQRGSEEDDLTAPKLLGLLSEAAGISSQRKSQETDSQILIPTPISNDEEGVVAENGEILPNVITFPFSRHSSYSELRGLVSAFRPRDIYPCVVNEAAWDEEKSVETLFGDLCTGGEFTHDNDMRRRLEEEHMAQEQLEEERLERELLESQRNLDRGQLERIEINFPQCRPEERATEGSKDTEDQRWIQARAMASSTASNTPTTSPAASPKRPERARNVTPVAPVVSPPLDSPPPKQVKREPHTSPSSSPPTGSAKRIKIQNSLHGTVSSPRRPGKGVRMSSVEREFGDSEKFWEGVEAALGIGGTWWDVELSCTMQEWRYEEEVEL
ncbi:unnamed protein product [Tuber melanosporum]|uniref:Protein artemis n=1 Tax=Tuber melanosporum (strain Mel28) TaxID=656061 RepID=D5GKT5_TUBMM|nr:uncharacterized protein GSTUM_00009761001 [Tuber melanosporum]CAZ85128.1 unnamed protein product [Tuber melanosporum]